MHLKNSQLSTNASPDSGVTLTVFKSQRRLIVNGTPSEQAKWLHHCSLDFGTRDDSDGILVPVWKKRENGIGKGEWDWEGSFARERKQSFDEPSKEIEGPDGHSLQELLLYPSLSLQGTNPARQEAAHILTRIIQASILGNVQATLRIKIPPLDEEEEKIRLLGEDFFPRAAVVTLFKHWRDSDHVHKKRRDRMNPIRCEKFFEACASSSIPSGQVDPVVEFGLACYWLGYRRKISRFQPFLRHPVYWYKRLADYLTSPNYCERFKLRLSILKEAAGEQIAAEQKIDDIINHLKELVVLSSINRVQLDDSLIASLNESFDEIEKISVDSEEYIELNKLLGLKQTPARSGTRRAVIQTLQHYQSSCHRILTIGEVIKAFISRY
ncbi:hypothetical protein OPQ81_006060 [Rhizoctonia solani]|nr:hypothetical protein OPQ81_006060 [Rhizoctonia solani]